MASTLGGGLRELIKKYGKVAVGVHLGVSGASITTLYVAIRNDVARIESLLDKLPIMGTRNPPSPCDDADAHQHKEEQDNSTRNRMTEVATSAGGALALAFMCNKALLPIRVPITMVLTPPVARFLARRSIIFKSGTK